MTEIKISSIKYSPKIKILNNHIITFDDRNIILYDLKGAELDNIKTRVYVNHEILDICKINNNNFIAMTEIHLLQIAIIKNRLKIKNKIIIGNNINDCLYIKKYNLFIVSNNKNFIIFDIYDKDTFKIGNIEIIPNKFQTTNLMKINENLLVAYGQIYISLYKKKLGIKSYELISKLKLHNILKLLKLDNKTFVSMDNNNNIFLINNKKMKIYQKYFFFDRKNVIDFIYVIKSNIYIHKNNNLFIFKFFKKELILIKLLKKNPLVAFNYLLNLSIENYFPYLKEKIKINCIKNGNY